MMGGVFEMQIKYADRVDSIKPSAIRELLNLHSNLESYHLQEDGLLSLFP